MFKMGSYSIKRLSLIFIKLCVYCISLFSLNIHANDPVNVFTGQYFLAEISIWIIGLLIVLIFTYFYFQTLISRTITLLLSSTCIALGIVSILEQYDHDRYLLQQYHHISDIATNIRARLESQIYLDLGVAKTLPIYMKSKDFIYTKEEVNALIDSVIETSPRIKHIAIAKDLIINHVYPLKGNTKAIGLDYRKNAEQWPDVERAIKSNKILLVGPVNLVQGGRAIIGRMPVYYSGQSDKDSGNLWGLISIVIDIDALFEAAGFNDDKGLNLAIRGMGAKGANGDVFFGDENLFSSNAVFHKLKLPEGSWEIAAMPVTGWLSESPTQWRIRLTILAFYLLVAFTIVIRAKHHLKQQRTNNALLAEIKENKQLEIEQADLNKKLNHSQKLKAIGQLTSGITHDFNNILTAISGYAQLAQTNISNNSDPEKSRHYLNEVIKAGNRAKDLIKQLMAFSRGKDIKSQAIFPKKIIQETITMLQSTIPSSIELNSNFSDNNTKIESDPIQLQQVVMNLIVNSRDSFKNERGEINISLEKIKIKNQICTSCNEKFSGKYLQLTISDNGTGISNDTMERIFEPFFTTKQRSEGSGMGLSVVHGIMHSASGHIVLKSAENMGTTIKLLYPIFKGDIEEKDTTHTDEVSPLQISGHVLIIDDEQPIINLFSNLVINMGMKASIFADPVQALEYYQQHMSEITLILTDETMPSLKGSELIKQIRVQNSNVPIILCSGYNEIMDQISNQTLGINAFFTKPVDLNALTKEIYKQHS